MSKKSACRTLTPVAPGVPDVLLFASGLFRPRSICTLSQAKGAPQTCGGYGTLQEASRGVSTATTGGLSRRFDESRPLVVTGTGQKVSVLFFLCFLTPPCHNQPGFTCLLGQTRPSENGRNRPS